MARWCHSSAFTPTSCTTSTSTTAPPIRWTRSIRRISPRTPRPSPWSRTRWPRCRRRCRVRRLGRRHIRSTAGGAMQTGGNTRGDAKFDIDGAIATLAHYAELGAQLGSLRALRDGEAVQLGRTARYAGIHLWVPRDGLAVHINAFNFPAWGTCEKAACALLAGMPILSKPATSTALVAWRTAELGAEILPRGAFQFVCGSPGDLLDQLGPQDVVAFTGSSQTAGKLREQLARRGARLNVEADSLNAAGLGPYLQTGSAPFGLFVPHVGRH